MESGSHPVVIEDWAPAGLLRAVDAEWPSLDWRYWHKYAEETAVKYGSMDASRLPGSARLLMSRMAEIDLASLGIDVTAFPDLELHGAGLHCIPPGGHLGTHLDGAVHPLTGWHREVNAILFVGQWQPEWGGDLCFFEDGGEAPASLRVSPRFNRLVLFRTGDSMWHGVEKVTGPNQRRTLSMFWWSAARMEATRDRAKFL
ncbi:MAG: 2OG-Fe(II) oxygenase [Planctomycetota bacterium]|nr:MAG: 2OG-Fe(II) oxygenase [Planctomycetota bacterium]REK25318.1 MAG: 2OG-Fe(II) oxygenase [Planctomycetota bacterium]REK31803.1 MAG: 2OG-Fe(II) oxygenase [Planctomycetota bacterium]